MSGRMAITTNNGFAWLSVTLFRANYMNNPLTWIIHVVFSNAEFPAILVQSLNLHMRDGIVYPSIAIGGRHIVIRDSEICAHSARLAASLLKTGKRLWRCHFV